MGRNGGFLYPMREAGGAGENSRFKVKKWGKCGDWAKIKENWAYFGKGEKFFGGKKN